jgi:hypothetical protein
MRVPPTTDPTARSCCEPRAAGSKDGIASTVTSFAPHTPSSSKVQSAVAAGISPPTVSTRCFRERGNLLLRSLRRLEAGKHAPPPHNSLVPGAGGMDAVTLPGTQYRLVAMTPPRRAAAGPAVTSSAKSSLGVHTSSADSALMNRG